MSMKTDKRNHLKLSVMVLWAISVCAVAMVFVALLSVIYVGTNDLPKSCKGWSVGSTISSNCKQDIAALQRLRPQLCYDNSDYIPCEVVALEVLEGRRLLLIASGVAVLAAVPAIAITTIQTKSNRASVK